MKMELTVCPELLEIMVLMELLVHRVQLESLVKRVLRVPRVSTEINLTVNFSIQPETGG